MRGHLGGRGREGRESRPTPQLLPAHSQGGLHVLPQLFSAWTYENQKFKTDFFDVVTPHNDQKHSQSKS